MSEKTDRRRASYTDEHRRFLETNADGRSYEALAALFNQEFGTDIGRLTISKLCRRFGFSNGSTSRRPYSDKQIQFLRQNAPGVDYYSLAIMFNERFGTNINVNRVGEICRRKGFSNGLDCRYKEGHAVNLGRKLPNAAPDGSECIHSTGYVKLKHNGVWRFKHIILWEQAHGRSVPEGHFIVFGDSNNRNFNIENLFCITPAQNAIRCRMELQGVTPELAAAGVALAKLYSQIGERKKAQKRKRRSNDV